MRSASEGKSNGQPRVVVVGAGFGGLAVARRLARAPVEIILIDRENHHLFQPLLYQVATAGLSPADIAWPIRGLLRGQRNARVLLGEVTGVDRERKVVLMGGREIAWDFLVLATGVTHGYFGHDDWAEHAPGLKTLDDATRIRRRVLMAFEAAEMADDAAARERLQTIVIVGGGPTGVELAGAIAELARKALAADFRNIDPRDTRVLLVEAGSALLPGFGRRLSGYTSRMLQDLGVEVRLGRSLTDCEASGVLIDDEFVPAATVIWAAGNAASPAARWLGVEPDRMGRVPVDDRLQPEGRGDVFVIGDTALCLDARGAPLPGIAPVAKQQGTYAGRVIAARISGGQAPEPFRYSDRGLFATIGRRAAVITYKRLRIRGWPAWWLWGVAHVYFLISMRNRLLVLTQWLWSYVTYERGARLITGSDSRQSGDGQ